MVIKEDKKEEQLNNLQDIRKLMDRSSRFSALSGISSITAGIIAIFGCLYVAFQLDFPIYAQAQNIMHWNNTPSEKITIKFLITTGFAVAFLSFFAFLLFANQKAKKYNIKLFNSTGKKFIFNHVLFLLCGGLFAAILFYYSTYLLIVPALLIFYGLALINISKFSYDTIRNLGIIEIILGFILCLIPVYSFLFFFIGFGVLHIIYGLILHFKYDNQSE
ncbi:MAG: hypothetical protein JST55_06755 [Bacteroidetes bacterium]|nr:hypothetical protein [Bacteroidota bacterium]